MMNFLLVLVLIIAVSVLLSNRLRKERKKRLQVIRRDQRLSRELRTSQKEISQLSKEDREDFLKAWDKTLDEFAPDPTSPSKKENFFKY